MVETFEGGWDVPQHGPVYPFFCIISVKINAQVLCACPIVGDGVVFLEDGHEVLDILLNNAFHAEIINAQRKRASKNRA